MNTHDPIIRAHVKAAKDAIANEDEKLLTGSALALLERALVDLNRIAAALEKLTAR